jgi:hypothetical protein
VKVHVVFRAKRTKEGLLKLYINKKMPETFKTPILILKTDQRIIVVAFLCFLFLFGISSCDKDDDDPGYSAKELLIFDLNDEINADSIEFLVNWMQGMGTRFALAENQRSVADRIRERFRMIGYLDAEIDSFIVTKTYNGTRYQRWEYNVIASLEGSIYPDSVSIMGGHYDNIVMAGDPFLNAPGANDNASGVAAALEIARVMKKKNYLPDGTIRFIAFASEELGLYGSFDYAGKAKVTSENIKVMLNNDMIAYQPLNDKSAWIVNIIDYENSGSLRKKAETLCSRFTLLKYKNDNKYNRQSDSYPFSVNGYKSLFFFSDIIDPEYHTLNDVASNCNFEYCREIVKLNCALLIDCN